MSKITHEERVATLMTRLQQPHGLLTQYSLSSHGVWHVVGETDGANYSSGEDLGFLEGTLRDIIDYAAGRPEFWSWGDGGDITPVKIRQINARTLKKEQKIREELVSAEARVAALRSQLPE